MKKIFDFSGRKYEIYSNDKLYGADKTEYISVQEVGSFQKGQLAYCHAGKYWKKSWGAAFMQALSEFLGWEY